MSDRLSAPYKVALTVDTYAGDWTAEQIAAGLAGEPVRQTEEQWYEPGPDGPVPITDPARIAALEQRITEGEPCS